MLCVGVAPLHASRICQAIAAAGGSSDIIHPEKLARLLRWQSSAGIMDIQ